MKLPLPGQVYAFRYSDHDVKDQICPLLVLDVTETHVFYTFPDTDYTEELGYRHVYPMRFETWINNAENRVFTGFTAPAAQGESRETK